MNLTYVVLYVASVEKSIKFYQEAFDLEHNFTHESGMYAEMKTGETTLSFCQHELAENIVKRKYSTPEKNNKLIGMQITFSPNDIKASFAKALSAGATALSEPEIKPWNFEVAIVQDVDGHIVELAKSLDEQKK